MSFKSLQYSADEEVRCEEDRDTDSNATNWKPPLKRRMIAPPVTGPVLNTALRTKKVEGYIVYKIIKECF